MQKTMLKTRIVTAVCLLAGLLGALFFLPDTGWSVLCALICAGAAWEWGGLARWNGKARVAYAAALGVLCFVLAGNGFMPWFRTSQILASSESVFFESVAYMFFVFAMVWVLLATVFWLLVAPFWLKYKWPLGKWSAAVTGCIVLMPPFIAFMILRHAHPLVALMAVAPVWVADIAAYFSGRAFGRKKLAPGISPGKTWAGAVGAALGVMVYCGLVFTAILFDSYFGYPLKGLAEFLGLAKFLVLALVLNIVWSVGFTALCIEGDLFESLLKRQAGVKDSGKLLPGHGGILDRIDSLTSTLPFICVVLQLIAVFSLLV
jgi:phosphatidate cytidylyltransferase